MTHCKLEMQAWQAMAEAGRVRRCIEVAHSEPWVDCHEADFMRDADAPHDMGDGVHFAIVFVAAGRP
jgi:hypothetical protein